MSSAPVKSKFNLSALAKILSNAGLQRMMFADDFEKQAKQLKRLLIKNGVEIEKKSNISDLLTISYEHLLMHYRHEYLYKVALLNSYVLENHCLSDTILLNEFRIGNSKADAILVNGTNKVFEIKTELDSPERLFTLLKITFLILVSSFVRVSAQTANDDVTFQIALKNFQSAVLHRNSAKAANIIYFPLFTSKAYLGSGQEMPADAITIEEFELYKNDIFNAEVSRILPRLGKEAASEIVGNDDPYYVELKKARNVKGKMYECYAQYPSKNGKGENYFAFIFGKINNKYKVIAYYSKWPLR